MGWQGSRQRAEAELEEVESGGCPWGRAGRGGMRRGRGRRISRRSRTLGAGEKRANARGAPGSSERASERERERERATR
jgi:hypothetical protein